MNRLRFAPSPTGFVHVGNARTALFNYLYAGKTGGKMILRIEDTDVERSRREYEENLIRDLNWLGIEWDEGPDRPGACGPYRQSERLETYMNYARQLLRQGDAYYCFCSPKDEVSGDHSDSTPTACSCRQMDPMMAEQRYRDGEPAGIRFRVPRDCEITFYDHVREDMTFDSNLINDLAIIRSSGMPTYNFSVVIDDHLMDINLVIRGEDHLSNTARQALIYKALGFPPPQFAHLSMVMGEDNQKLSKRHGSTSLVQFREEGYLPQALFNYLALLGWAPSGSDQVVFSKSQLLEAFDIDKVSKSAAIFDYQKLKWLNREHIRLLDDESLAEYFIPFLQRIGFTFDNAEAVRNWIVRATRVVSNYHCLFTEIAADFSQFTDIHYPEELIRHVRENSTAMKVISMVAAEIETIPSPVPFSAIQEITKKIQKEQGIKGRELYHPIRLALTGKESGIELQDFIPIIETGAMLAVTPAVRNMAERFRVFLA